MLSLQDTQNRIQQSGKTGLLRGGDICLWGIAAAADPDSGAPRVFGGPHIRLMISNEICLVRVNAGKSASGKYHGWRGFAALAFFIRTVGTVKGGQNTPAVFLHLPNDSLMSFPEIVPADQTTIDPGLVADQNDPYAVAVEKLERFESVLIKANFFKVLYIIGPVYIQYTVPVQNEEPAVFRLGRTEPYKHFYRCVLSESEYTQIRHVKGIYYKHAGVESGNDHDLFALA